VLDNKRRSREGNKRQQFVRPIRAYHIIDDPFRRCWENDHHERTEDRASQSSGSHPWIPLEISKNAPDRFHRLIKVNALVITSR
jgi:hypothetical protein